MNSKTKINLIYSSSKAYAIDVFKRKKYLFELGLCYLLEGNLKETKKIWNKLDKNKNSMIYFSRSMLGFIENKIREAFGFKGTPLRFIIRERKEDK